MSTNTGIEWTDATWNPVRGCTRVSEGCRNCYAEIMAARFSKPGQWGHGFAEMKGGDHRWTGKVELIESQLRLPLSWKQPRRIFVNSTSDLFHESLPAEAIDRIFAVMALCPQHTFQVLTKRADRMCAYLGDKKLVDRIIHEAFRIDQFDGAGLAGDHEIAGDPILPLPNVWLGVSVEDQNRADERIPHLLKTPAAVRFISAEPLLGPLDLNKLNRSDWVICGGESGPGARPMHPDWCRSLRDQCADADVPFFFKQWGEHHPDGQAWPDGSSSLNETPGEPIGFGKVGKKKAGHLLDGRAHHDFPAERI